MPADLHPVRVATEADAAAVQAIYAPNVTDAAISFEVAAPTVAEMAGRIRDTLATYPYYVYAAEGEILGYAYAGAHRARAAYRWSVDVTAYVRADARRRGVGRSLYTALLQTLARQHFHTAYAGITLPNAGSVCLHEAVGFVHIGTYEEVGFKFGRWHDVGWWRRRLTDDAVPAEPIPFADLPAER